MRRFFVAEAFSCEEDVDGARFPGERMNDLWPGPAWFSFSGLDEIGEKLSMCLLN